MRKSIKKDICIFGKMYKVKLCKEVLDDNGNKLDAMIVYDDAIIRIDRELNPKEQHIALLHECFHAIKHRLLILPDMDSDLEDTLVDTFATFVVEDYIKFKEK